METGAKVPFHNSIIGRGGGTGERMDLNSSTFLWGGLTPTFTVLNLFK